MCVSEDAQWEGASLPEGHFADTFWMTFSDKATGTFNLQDFPSYIQSNIFDLAHLDIEVGFYCWLTGEGPISRHKGKLDTLSVPVPESPIALPLAIGIARLGLVTRKII